MFVTCEVSAVTREVKRTVCEHCGHEVPNNVYARAHGDKCAYKDAPKGSKKCRTCGEYVALEHFTRIKGTVVDGLNTTCNFCLSRRYYEKAYPVLFGKDEEGIGDDVK